MQLQIKQKLAFLSALALLFSYAEMILPRPLPFLRFGFGNIALLLSLELPFSQFLLLAFFKSCVSSLVSGTLFSPFFLISISQTFASGLLMYFLAFFNRKSGARLFSVYGISVSGSVLSAAVQVYCCVLYLGYGVTGLLGPMIIFNTLSGILTAFFSTKIGVHSFESLNLSLSESGTKQEKRNSSFFPQIFAPIFLLSVTGSVFFIQNTYALVVILLSGFIAQKICKRKIFILPHLFMWIFVLVSSIFEPSGKVLFKIWHFSVTDESLFLAFQKSIRLSAAAAFSQCAFLLKLPENSILALTLECYKKMNESFRNTDGSVFQKLKAVLGKQQ